VQHYDDTDTSMPWKGPLVVVTSKFSASASEIFAGAIQDYHRGIVVGDTTTHGKGTVQSLLNLGQQLFRIPNPPNLGALKITMQQFYRPGGASTQKRGVLADIVLPSLTDHMDVSEDDLDYALEFDKVETTEYPMFRMTSDEQIKQLAEASAARQAASEDFAKLGRNIQRYRKQKERSTLTLNESKFLEERKDLDADKEEEKQFEEQVNGSDEVVKRDFYFNEVLAITADYVSSLNKNKIAATQR
jgi:carboxyl-terminal processing protease